MEQNNRQNALADYVEVNVRIEKFYEKFPNGRIITELVSWANEVVVMKAIVYRDLNDQYPSATGHAYEKEGSSFINKTSALENCETSAVGRALAMLGFEIKKSVASKEEVANAKLNQGNDYQSSKDKVKVKYLTLGCKEEEFEKWYSDQRKKYNDNQIESFLTKKLMDKKKGA